MERHKLVLAGKVCLVTGGGSGLGKATARRFLSHGARVAILDMEEEGAKAVQEEFGKDKCIYTVGNICKEEDVNTCLKYIENEFGSLHVIINNAGIWNGMRRIYDFQREKPADMDWIKHSIEVDLIGTINVTRLSVGLMGKNPPDEDGERGVIINTGSISGMDAYAYQIGYVAAKGAVVAMTPALATEFADMGIRVNTLCPGPMQTNILENVSPTVRQELGMLVASGAPIRRLMPRRCHLPARPGLPDEFAHACQSVVLNKMINGAVIRLDGLVAVYLQPEGDATPATIRGQ